MNDQERRDAAKRIKRDHKNHLDDDHGRYETGWAQRFGGRMKKDQLP
ncbi:MAG: hypothetical protein GYA24_23700 [Candidatus Lokiarchaeota archaeon]|nr:hypothetical protein [Candidatus Lokiarchaeota archaeon]